MNYGYSSPMNGELTWYFEQKAAVAKELEELAKKKELEKAEATSSEQ